MAFNTKSMACLYASVVVALIVLLTIFKEGSFLQLLRDEVDVNEISIQGTWAFSPPCDEIYMVREGETLYTISDKCGDFFITENNPHINDPDDVFPGLVISITPIPSLAGNNKSII